LSITYAHATFDKFYPSSVKFCLLLDFLRKFLTNLASTGGLHEISQQAVGWTALIYLINVKNLSQTVANLGPRPLKYVTFYTYKLAKAKYNLNFKLMHNHLFRPIPLNILFKKKLSLL